MRLTAEYPGDAVRFEGDRTVHVQGLPQGAQIKHATITLTPVAAPGRPLFEEVLIFSGSVGDFGMTKTQHSVAGAVAEVNFHARRTLAFVHGSSDLLNSELAVDPGGGVFMGINTRGATATSDDSELYTVPSNGALPGLLVAKFRLNKASGTLNISQVTVHTAANNPTLAFEGMPPFWVQPGEIVTPVTTPNFAEFLQIYLQEAQVQDGRYRLPLIIHSDSLTRLDVLVDIEYKQQQSALPGSVDEIALPYGFDGTAQTDSAMVQVTMPVGAEVTEASAQVLGAFDSSRIVFGPTGPLTPVTAVPVTAAVSQAQPIMLQADTAATSIDLLLSSISQAAVLDLSLLGDVDGKPFSKRLLSAPVTLELDRELAADPTWISARLPEEFQFIAGTRYWLVIQAQEGEAVWHSQTAGDGALQRSTSGGLAWRATEIEGVSGLLAGLFRLRRVPDQFEMPLSLQVGEGDTAVPVSLDRFAPLGRVDFTIDFPELAAAINEAARRTEATSCARGEQLQNEGFSRWHTVGESFGPLQEVSLLAGGSVVTFDIAPNGEWAFGSGEDGVGAAITLPLHQILANKLLAPFSSQHVAISADSQRIYLITEPGEGGDRLVVIDATTFEPLGDLLTGLRSSCLALSPDGRRLYIASFAGPPEHGEVWVVDTALLVQALAADEDAVFDDILVGDDPILMPNPIPLPDNVRAASMVVSPDSRRLFVAGTHTTTMAGNVYAFDTGTHQPLLTGPMRARSDPRDLALAPDGRRLLVANAGDGTVTVLDAMNLREESIVHLTNTDEGTLQPVSIVIEPNGRRAFAACLNTASISVIDLNTLEVHNPVPVGEPDLGDFDLAVTPSGDRLYVGLQKPYPEASSGLRFLPLGRQHPDSWTLTTGFVMPVPLFDPFYLTAVLGPMTLQEKETRPARTSSLSQAVAVVGGCTYDFSFWGVSNSLEAVAEVIWRGAECAVERTDRMPIQMPEFEAVRLPTGAAGGSEPLPITALVSFPGKSPIDLQLEVARSMGELLFHRIRLEAPPGATQAEIRFLVPPNYNAVLDTVSFQATSDTIANGDLMLVENGKLMGWQLVPASATGVTLHAADDGVELANREAESISLLQSFDVTGGQPFVLLLRGHIVSQLSGGTPAVELAWLDAAGNPLGSADGTTSLTMATGQQEHSLEAVVPVSAARAELSLVLPAGTTLGVRQISFVPVEMVTVPIHFLAQAPGDLTVTDFNVAYEVGEVATTPPPDKGLCPPTPPGRGEDGKGGACSWCASPCGPCGDDAGNGAEHHEAEPAARPLLAAAPRRPLVVESRPALVNRPAAIAAPRPPEIMPVETAVAPLLNAAAEAWAERAPELAAASLAPDAVNGIAKVRTGELAALGIDTVTRLAAADPQEIASALRFVTLPMAEAFVAEARSIRANVADLPAPLVSCIMPTFNRRPFLPLAISYFLRQNYPNRELIILDDGDDPVGDLVPDDKRIRYVRLEERLSIGAKRNRGGEEACGPILASWDDDAWAAPWRLSYQVAALTEYGADVVGLDNVLHYDPFAQRAWRSVRPSGRLPWMAGSTFCYSRTFWQSNPFPDVQLGEDIRFLRQKNDARIVPLQAISWLVDIIHEANTSPKPVDSPLWFPFSRAEMLALLGDDAAVYAELAAAV